MSAHHARLVTAAWWLGFRPAFAGLRLRQWAHASGYRGYWLTKSRRYSTTFAAKQHARRIWRRTRTTTGEGEGRVPLDAFGRPDGHEATVTVTRWRFHGVGYTTTGDRYLALTAADQARSRRAAARAARPAVRGQRAQTAA